MEQPDHIIAHEASSYHRETLLASATCGCFYCLTIFEPGRITKWIDRATTALCPQCGIDSVIGSASGYPVTQEFLRKMHAYWFAELREGNPDKGRLR